MSDIRIRAVIFDLDGTLVDSAGEIASALDAALLEVGLPCLAKERVEAMIGGGVRVLVERALAELDPLPGPPPGKGDLDDVVRRFEAHYARVVGTEARLFAGVMPGLERLRDGAVPMSVVTNKPRFFTVKLLQRLGIDAFFRAIVAGDDGIERKPSGRMLEAACERMGTAPAGSLMLGDSGNDVAAARAAGCPVWCVPYGYNEGRPVQTLACDRVVESVAEVARILMCDASHIRG